MLAVAVSWGRISVIKMHVSGIAAFPTIDIYYICNRKTVPPAPVNDIKRQPVS